MKQDQTKSNDCFQDWHVFIDKDKPCQCGRKKNSPQPIVIVPPQDQTNSVKRDREKKAWTMFFLWVACNLISYLIFSPLIILSNLVWFVYLITKTK